MRTKKQSSGIVAGILLPMGLICLFAGCSLFLALLGGNAYKSIQASVDDGMGSTVAASYLRTKLGQAGGANSVQLRNIDGTQVLVIESTVGERTYETLIYAYTRQSPEDGTPQTVLLETFQSASAPFTPGAGTTIAEIDSCTFSLSSSGLLRADITSLQGTVTHVTYAITQGGTL